jgi:hypothetical protein
LESTGGGMVRSKALKNHLSSLSCTAPRANNGSLLYV